MLTISELISIFFPLVPYYARLDLVKKCESVTVNYEVDSWSLVMYDEISLQKTQLNLIRTYYQLQYGYDGVANEVLASLERWSEGTLIFAGLNNDENAFYQRLYTFIAFQNFEYLDVYRQIFLLSTRYLPWAILWKLPVVENVSRFFASYCELVIIKTDADLFAGAIEQNKTVIQSALPTGSSFAIEKWVQLYKKFVPKEKQNKLAEFTTAHLAPVLDEVALRQVSVILGLYEDLFSDSIWKKIKLSLCYHEKVGSDKIKFDADTYYLHRLSQTQDVLVWLKDAEEIGDWAAGKPDSFMKKLFTVISDKVDFANGEHVKYLSLLLDEMSARGIEFAGKVIFFDEGEGKFHWNKELLV